MRSPFSIDPPVESTVTKSDILKAIQELDMFVGRDPIAEWMTSMGFDPADDCYLLLPPKLHDLFNIYNRPHYVILAHHINKPTFIRDICGVFGAT